MKLTLLCLLAFAAYASAIGFSAGGHFGPIGGEIDFGIGRRHRHHGHHHRPGYPPGYPGYPGYPGFPGPPEPPRRPPFFPPFFPPGHRRPHYPWFPWWRPTRPTTTTTTTTTTAIPPTSSSTEPTTTTSTTTTESPTTTQAPTTQASTTTQSPTTVAATTTTQASTTTQAPTTTTTTQATTTVTDSSAAPSDVHEVRVRPDAPLNPEAPAPGSPLNSEDPSLDTAPSSEDLSSESFSFEEQQPEADETSDLGELSPKEHSRVVRSVNGEQNPTPQLSRSELDALIQEVFHNRNTGNGGRTHDQIQAAPQRDSRRQSGPVGLNPFGINFGFSGNRRPGGSLLDHWKQQIYSGHRNGDSGFPGLSLISRALSKITSGRSFNDALNDARQRLRKEIHSGENLEDGVRLATRQALESDDPQGGVRNLIETVTRTYQDAARNCPLIAGGAFILEEGTRLIEDIFGCLGDFDIGAGFNISI